VNSRSIYGCTEAPDIFKAPSNTLLTYNPNTKRLYVHLLDWPLERVVLANMADKVKYIQLLNDASEVNFSQGKGENANDLYLSLPVQKPPVEIPVMEVILK